MNTDIYSFLYFNCLYMGYLRTASDSKIVCDFFFLIYFFNKKKIAVRYDYRLQDSWFNQYNEDA